MVKKININYDKLYELTHPVNYYDKGISSHIFCYDKDTLVKFDKNLLGPADRMTSDKIASYMDYRDRFGKRNQLFACNIVAQQDTLSRLQDKVILTSFPKGVVFYEGLPVGLLIKKFDDYEKIKANNLSYNEMYHIFDKIVNAQEELMDNNIYNVEGAFAEKALFNKGNGDVQLISLNGPRLKICHGRNRKLENDTYENLVISYQILNHAQVANPGEYIETMLNAKLKKVTKYTFGDSLYQIDQAVKKIGRR